jgi:hypothetical protein
MLFMIVKLFAISKLDSDAEREKIIFELRQ